MSNPNAFDGPWSDPLPTARLGGFTLVKRLASGGMATVYLGHRRHVDGHIEVAAIKVILPHLVHDTEYVEMFFDEARLTSSVQHPNVCRVLESGVEEGLHFLATEYILGETWADLVDALHARPGGKAAAPFLIPYIVTQVCEALHAAHEACDERGKPLAIVHRDLCPQNVMIGYDGSVRLLDFGIASAAERLHETRSGVVKGHLGYMAPEQIQTEAVDRRCDLWAAGVMLWEGVTGRRLFKRADARATIMAVTTDELESLLWDVEPLHPLLRSVIERSVVRDADARFASAREMGDHLFALARGSSPTALARGSAPMSDSQVASWMRHLFGERLETKRHELTEAVRRPDASIDWSRSPMGGAARPSQYPALVAPAVGDDDAPTQADLGRACSSPANHARPRAERYSVRRFARAGGLFMFLLVGTVLVVKVSHRAGTISVLATSAAQGAHTQIVASSHARDLTATSAPASRESAPRTLLEVVAPGDPVRVECDGQELGATPLLTEIEPGKHRLQFLPSTDELPAETEIMIRAGDHYLMKVERAATAP